MKHGLTLLLLTSLIPLQAQRYLEPVFLEVTVHSSVTYGVNASVLWMPLTGEIIPQSLECDIYEPTGNTLATRPL